MRSHSFARAVAIAAVTALGGLGLTALTQTASAAVTIPAKPYDFDGDGKADVAIGSPYGKVGTKTSAGFVSVIYGSGEYGLNKSKKRVFSQNSANVPGAAESYDHFGYSLASADFDRNGYADLAIGAPDEDLGYGSNAGLLTILWGSSKPLGTYVTAMAEFGGAGAGHRWGETLAVGDIEHDGSPELFVSVPGTSTFKWFYFDEVATASGVDHGTARPGGTHVVPRTAKKTKGEVSAQSLADVNNTYLATGDVTGDGHDDLAYGWYDADWPVAAERRGFVVFPGNESGEFDYEYGTVALTEVGSLGVADFDRNGFADVAVGQPSDAGSLGGRVTVYRGSAAGVTVPDPSIDQNTTGVPGAPAAGDAFGGNLAVGDVNRDGFADLAVGVANDPVGTVAKAGRAYMLYGSSTGLTGTGAEAISQSTTGVPGGSETNDHFGYQVTLLDTTNDGFADLTIGAPNENSNNGAITWIKGTPNGIVPVCRSLWVGTYTFGVTGLRAELGRRLGH